MKKYFLLTLACASFLQSETPTAQPSSQSNTNTCNPVFVNFNNQFSHNTLQFGDAVIKKAHELWSASSLFFETHYHSLGQSLTLCAQVITEHAYTLIGCTAAASYLGLQARFAWLSSTLENQQLWSLWRFNFSLDELTLMDHDLLARDLVKDIQRIYTNPENPTDFVIPLITFMKTVDVEEKQLQEYTTLGSYIETCHLTFFSLYSPARALEYKERIQRLALLKTRFLEWLAEYKIKKEHDF